MKKFIAVFTFYLKEILLAKSTLISAILIYGIILAFFGVGQLASDKKEINNVALIQTGNPIPIQLAEIKKNLSHVTLQEEEEGSLPKLQTDVKEGRLDGIILLENNTNPTIKYIYNSSEDTEMIAILSQSIKQAYINQTISENQINPETAQKLLTPLQVEKEALKDTKATFGIVYVFVFLMYLFIAIFGQMIASSIVSEKSSRVMEVVISKVKPIYLMYAKVFSILVAGLFQFFVIGLGILTSYLLGWLNKEGFSLFGLAVDFQNLSLFVIASFIIYFILGFLLYAMIYAAIGSMVSRTEDLSSISMPIIICVMAGFFIGLISLFDATRTYVIVSSYIPLFSPFVTFARIVSGEAGLVEVGISIGLLLISIGVINYIASKVYVQGVMNYSDKVKLGNIIAFRKKNEKKQWMGS